MPQSRYRCDRAFFDDVSTELQAYWLGFIAADGYVSDRGTVAVGLAMRDREHLVRLREALASEHPIYTHRQGPGSYQPGVAYPRLMIGSLQLAAGLARHGVGPRKSLTLNWPGLPAPLLRHYLRGYFDGDGTFSLGVHRGPRRSNMYFGLMGSIPFLEGCRAYLGAELGLGVVRLVRKRPGDAYAALTYCGRGNVRRLWHLMYDGATVWLPRKREKVVDAINLPDIVPKLTATLLLEARARYAAGEGIKPIAVSMGVAFETLRERLLRQGFVFRPPDGTTAPEERAALVARYAAGASPTALGREYGISKQAVIQMAMRYGVRRRGTEPPSEPPHS